jgi:hypothetical protein
MLAPMPQKDFLHHLIMNSFYRYGIALIILLTLSVFPLKAEGELPDRPLDSVLVFDFGEIFSESQEKVLQEKAARVLKEHNQPVIIFTANDQSFSGSGGDGVLSLVKGLCQKWWPPLPEKSLNEILAGGTVKVEESDEWLKLMNSSNLMLIVFDTLTGEAAVNLPSGRATPYEHDRKNLVRRYVLPLASRGEPFDAASLGLDAIEASLAKKSLPSEPVTFKSTMKMIFAISVILLVLFGLSGRAGNSGPFYYIGYIFTIVGGLFASMALLSGKHDRYNRYEEEAMRGIEGTFKDE